MIVTIHTHNNNTILYNDNRECVTSASEKGAQGISACTPPKKYIYIYTMQYIYIYIYIILFVHIYIYIYICIRIYTHISAS